MKIFPILLLLVVICICSCSSQLIDKEFHKLGKIGTDEPLSEILMKHACTYPLYVNGAPDSVKILRQAYPNPCSPSEIRTFIFLVEEDALVQIKLQPNSDNSIVDVFNKNLSRGYYKLTFPGIDRKYFEDYVNSNRKENVTVSFLIGKKSFYYYLFNG